MNIPPNIWNRFAQGYYGKQALDLYRQFDEDHNQGKFDIVLDIGCGTGNITFQLDRVVNVGQIYGLDIDEKMIAFAKQNHSKDNICYLIQDFGVEFECMAPELRALEGKVSLITSNGCLQHILDKKTKTNTIIDKELVAKNLYRFLRKGGKVYTQMEFIFDGYKDLTEDNRKLFKDIPQRQQEFNEWSNAFKSVGFHVINGLDDKRILRINFKTFVNWHLSWYLAIWPRYFIGTDPDQLKHQTNELSAKILSKTKRFTDEITGESMVNEDIIQFQFSLQK